MPKPKPTQVIRHEIGLTRDTKELVEGVVGAYQFNRVSTPVVAALSDVSFLVFLGSVLAAWKIIDKETWDSMIRGSELTLDAILEALGMAWDVGGEFKKDVESLAGAKDYWEWGGETGPIESTLPELLEWIFGFGRSDLREGVRGGR